MICSASRSSARVRDQSRQLLRFVKSTMMQCIREGLDAVLLPFQHDCLLVFLQLATQLRYSDIQLLWKSLFA
eukprot:2329788-Pyramimonas_sp.AAC.1